MCKVFKVSSSAYYVWLNEKEDKANRLDEIDLYIIKSFENSFQTYGSPRIAEDINKEGYVCSEATVARRMKAMNIKS